MVFLYYRCKKKDVFINRVKAWGAYTFLEIFFLNKLADRQVL